MLSEINRLRGGFRAPTPEVWWRLPRGISPGAGLTPGSNGDLELDFLEDGMGNANSAHARPLAIDHPDEPVPFE